MIKNLIKKLFILLSKNIMPLFYKKKYLVGRWFDDSLVGWRWCWKGLLWQKIFGINRNVPWPVSFKNTLGSKWENIEFDPDDMNNFHGFGVYYQNLYAKIIIGKGSYIGPNVGLITANHSKNNLDEHEEGKDILIGKNCWIGMNSVILPGVILGDNVIVGAGSIVTKSFEDGNCVIAGNPARMIKRIKR